MSQEIDIDQYRKSRGCLGNYSVLLIPRINNSSELLEEVIGSYTSPEEILVRVKKSILDFDDQKKKINNYKLEKVDKDILRISFVIITSLSNEILTIFRIYTNGEVEATAISMLVDKYFESLGLYNTA